MESPSISNPDPMEKLTQALKSAGLAIFQIVKAIVTFPQNLAKASRLRREQDAVDHLEEERLDRLRNPSNYIGR